jgi:hypothetical protein
MAGHSLAYQRNEEESRQYGYGDDGQLRTRHCGFIDGWCIVSGAFLGGGALFLVRRGGCWLGLVVDLSRLLMHLCLRGLCRCRLGRRDVGHGVCGGDGRAGEEEVEEDGQTTLSHLQLLCVLPERLAMRWPASFIVSMTVFRIGRVDPVTRREM